MLAFLHSTSKSFRAGLIGGCVAALAACAHADPGTAADREALFDDVVAKIMAREAFSPIKNEAFGLTFPDVLEAHRAEFIAADTDEELYWALVRLSNARHDRHLSVFEAPGGIDIPTSYNHFDPADYPGVEIDTSLAPVASLRFLPDFSAEPVAYFVSDLAADLSMVEGGEQLAVGDIVVSVNGAPFADYLTAIAPYRAFSTMANFWMRSAMEMHEKNTVLPEDMYGETLALTLKKPDGTVYEVSAPYLPAETVTYRGIGEANYPGFEKVIDAVSFDTYRPTDGRHILVIDMYGFRDDLIEATDALTDYAKAEGLLDSDLIIDTTRSRGGGRGAYFVQRLTSHPFKTTFGNLRLSDITQQFIDDRRAQLEAGEEFNDGAPESVGDPWWLVEWLEGDVAEGLAAGQAYSNDVPFKLAHLPEWSDGILQPAEDHFTGNMIVWYSPYGGSHLDQFASIIHDNGLGLGIGMPPGGFSNTWEWEEALAFPTTGEPVATFMWNIGHTIRPNGQILEGNPAAVDEYIPLTAENHPDYYGRLMSRSLELLADGQ